ncbi:sensor histidine kinase [Roseateles puraquae]|uniref:sensor histidine kinase n=1 Tax=Roseateles puraquae TaxID=431059 RepID=UPI0031DF0388
MPGLRALLRPTLPRRLFGALVLAFGLVAAALLALDYAEFKHDMATHPGVQTLADHLGATLADTDEPRDAALVTQASAQMLNRMRRESGQLPGTVEFQLQDANGQTVFATPGATTVRPGTHWTAEARRGPWRLVIAEPRVSDTTVLGWFGRELAGYLLLAFPLVLLPLWIAVRRGLQPLQQLTHTVSVREAHDLSPLGLTPRHDELRTLASAFDALLDRLRQQRDRERAFVQDAAHELRTPMAVVAAQAHLLAHAGGAPERERAATALNAALQRAAHLSRQLLTLATLDETRSGGTDEVDLTDLVEQTLAQLAPQAQALGLDLSLDAPPSLRVRLPRAAFETVLLNLLDNALRYVPAGGRVAVTLEAGRHTLCLRVEDDGPGIPPADREAAFERFWRGATGAEVAGTGLGLAIVRRAALRLGGGVRITDGLDGRGCGLVVSWPKAH